MAALPIPTADELRALEHWAVHRRDLELACVAADALEGDEVALAVCAERLIAWKAAAS
jgi:hypothetical protein